MKQPERIGGPPGFAKEREMPAVAHQRRARGNFGGVCQPGVVNRTHDNERQILGRSGSSGAMLRWASEAIGGKSVSGYKRG